MLPDVRFDGVSALGPLKTHLEAEQRRSLELREEQDLERQRASQVDALRAVLEVEQRRSAALREERDRCHEKATASSRGRSFGVG